MNQTKYYEKIRRYFNIVLIEYLPKIILKKNIFSLIKSLSSMRVNSIKSDNLDRQCGSRKTSTEARFKQTGDLVWLENGEEFYRFSVVSFVCDPVSRTDVPLVIRLSLTIWRIWLLSNGEY